jgi:hypothetical protein
MKILYALVLAFMIMLPCIEGITTNIFDGEESKSKMSMKDAKPHVSTKVGGFLVSTNGKHL